MTEINRARTVSTARTWHRCPHCGGGIDATVIIEPDTASPTHRATETEFVLGVTEQQFREQVAVQQSDPDR
jgi:hypothetical protein